jgi:hypothetical protein
MCDKIKKIIVVFSIVCSALIIVASVIVPIVLAICLRHAGFLLIWGTTPILLVVFWALLDLIDLDLEYHR